MGILRNPPRLDQVDGGLTHNMLKLRKTLLVKGWMCHELMVLTRNQDISHLSTLVRHRCRDRYGIAVDLGQFRYRKKKRCSPHCLAHWISLYHSKTSSIFWSTARGHVKGREGRQHVHGTRNITRFFRRALLLRQHGTDHFEVLGKNNVWQNIYMRNVRLSLHI